MTEPKEEKCEACCGSGYINFWTDDGHISMRTCRRCDGYGYIKAKPTTNEEWLKSRSNKELANAIFSAFVESATMIGCCVTLEYFRTQIELIDALREWLKRPHK